MTNLQGMIESELLSRLRKRVYGEMLQPDSDPPEFDFSHSTEIYLEECSWLTEVLEEMWPEDHDRQYALVSALLGSMFAKSVFGDISVSFEQLHEKFSEHLDGIKDDPLYQRLMKTEKIRSEDMEAFVRNLQESDSEIFGKLMTRVAMKISVAMRSPDPKAVERAIGDGLVPMLGLGAVGTLWDRYRNS